MGNARNMTKPRSRAYRRPETPTGAQAGWRDLPAVGCTLPAPELPALREWSTWERARWTELWESPQANAWDDSCVGTVALLVSYEYRLLAGDGGSAWVAQEARYAAEHLGLTPKALASLGWRIVDGE